MLMMEVCKPALRCGGESSSEFSAFCARCVLPDLASALVFTFLSFGAGLGPAFGDFFLARGFILRDFLSLGLDFSGSTSSSSSTSTSAFASSSSLLSFPSSSPSPSPSSPSPLLASDSSEELSGLPPSPPVSLTSSTLLSFSSSDSSGGLSSSLLLALSSPSASASGSDSASASALPVSDAFFVLTLASTDGSNRSSSAPICCSRGGSIEISPPLFRYPRVSRGESVSPSASSGANPRSSSFEGSKASAAACAAAICACSSL